MSHREWKSTDIDQLKCSENRKKQLLGLKEDLEYIDKVYKNALHYWLDTDSDNFFPRNTWYIECDECYIDCEDVSVILECIDPDFNFNVHDTYSMANGIYGGSVFVICGRHKKLPFAFNFHTDPKSIGKLISLKGNSK